VEIVSSEVTSQAVSKPRSRTFRALRLAVIVVGVSVPAVWLTARWIDRTGRSFYDTGRSAVSRLGELATALEQGDPRAARDVYAADFAGLSLGLAAPELVTERDGLRTYRLRPQNSGAERMNRDGALAEWQAYLAGFESIEEVGLHVQRVEDWSAGEDVVAQVRFELIGTPRGEPRAGIDRALFHMHLVKTESGLAIFDQRLIEGERQLSAEPQFVEVGRKAGIDFVNQYYPQFLSLPLKFKMLRFGPAGITAADYDDDGFYDLFIPDGVEARLFHNAGDGTFEDVTEATGLAGLDGVGVGLFADFDNDGKKDLFVSRTFRPNQIFRNAGDGTFEDVTAQTGMSADCCTTVASVADYDLDGDLDLYVGRYLDPREAIPTTFYARNGEPNRLYRNDGGFTFTDVTEEAGVGETGLCLGSVFGDYDDDGDPDLYVANDFGRKTLYRNEGDGTFTDVTVDSGTLAYGAGMSASFGDYDNDGRLDIYVAHIRSEHGWFAEAPTVARYVLNSYRQGVWKTDMPLYLQIFRQSGFDFVDVFQQMAAGNTLLHNRGDGTFEDVTWEASANPPGWFWGSSFADFDNDGWQDIYSTNGWVYGEPDTEIELEFLNNVVSEQKEYKTGTFFDPDNFGGRSWHGWERNRHLLNRRDGTFQEIGRAAGTDLVRNSRGIAVADFWNRGVLDIAVAASTDRHALLRNEVGSRRNWLAVEVTGRPELPEGSNRDGVGTRVRVRAGDLEMTREIALGDGYGSQNALRLQFGLGDADVVDEVVVLWPRSGVEQRFENVPANRILVVTEGEPELRTRALPSPLAYDTMEEADAAAG